MKNDNNRFTSKEKSWIMYDWANSSFATIMLAAIFPVFFTGLVANGLGDMWIGIGGSIATATSAILAPILGAVGDYMGMKKKLFAFFLALGVVTTAACAFFDSWQPLLAGYILSNIGFSGSLMLNDSMLPEITTPERMNRVSAWAYSMGYIGGSTIPFVASIALITFGESFGIDAMTATKISFLICSIWWAVFSIPILKSYKQEYGREIPKSGQIKEVFLSLWGCIKEIAQNKGVALFLIAYFFYIDGVGTVIKMSTAYGASLGLDSVGMILALLVTQLVAFPFAILFSKIAGKIGTLNSIIITAAIYAVICVLGFYMGFGVEEGFLTNDEALTIFWILAVMVGLAQGGIQAMSRAYFGMIIPKEKATEYFGFYDIFGRFAAILGPALYAIVRGVTGRSSVSILSLILFFIIGVVLLMFAKKHLPSDKTK